MDCRRDGPTSASTSPVEYWCRILSFPIAPATVFFSAEAIFIDLNWFAVLSGWGYPIEAFGIQNGSLYASSLSSATGLNDPVIQSLQGMIQRSGNRLDVSGAQLVCGSMEWTANGVLSLTSFYWNWFQAKTPTFAAPAQPDDWLRHWFDAGALAFPTGERILPVANFNISFGILHRRDSFRPNPPNQIPQYLPPSAAHSPTARGPSLGPSLRRTGPYLPI